MKPYPKYYPDIIQGTDEWGLIRCGMVTASRFKDAMAKGQGITRNKLMNQLAFERMYNRPAPRTFTKTKAMQHGNDTEDEARDYFGDLGKQLGLFTEDIKQVGFVEYNEDIGCSPDGLIGDDVLVELKCPETSTHMDYIKYGTKKLITTYNTQAQGQMFVTERKWCYIVSYDPLFDDRPCLWELVERDEKEIKKIHIEIVMFVNELKELMKEFNGSPF